MVRCHHAPGVLPHRRCPNAPRRAPPAEGARTAPSTLCRCPLARAGSERSVRTGPGACAVAPRSVVGLGRGGGEVSFVSFRKKPGRRRLRCPSKRGGRRCAGASRGVHGDLNGMCRRPRRLSSAPLFLRPSLAPLALSAAASSFHLPLALPLLFTPLPAPSSADTLDII